MIMLGGVKIEKHDTQENEWMIILNAFKCGYTNTYVYINIIRIYIYTYVLYTKKR